MELKLFSDLIDALGKVVGGVKAIVRLPETERASYLKTMDETYMLIETTLNMVLIRLGDILLLPDGAEFVSEVARLDNYEEWMKAEREFRLCKNLRASFREMGTLSGRLAGRVSARDWDTLLDQMHRTLAAEGEVAGIIVQQFEELAKSARSGVSDNLRERVAAFREALAKERQELIRQEVELYAIV
jgi:hypothetical protein